MICSEQLVGKYVLIHKNAFNECFRVSDASIGCQGNWPGDAEQMIQFVKKVDESDNTILVADDSNPESMGEWVSVVRIVRILGDTVSLNNNSDEDFLMLI